MKLMSLGASVNSRQGQSECAVRSLCMKTIKGESPVSLRGQGRVECLAA